MNSIQVPWHIAQISRAMMRPTIIMLEAVGCFFETWAAVYGANK